MIRKIKNETLGYIFVFLYFIGVLNIVGGLIIDSLIMIIVGFCLLIFPFILSKDSIWDRIAIRDDPNRPSEFPRYIFFRAEKPLWLDMAQNIILAFIIGLIVKYI